jgi:hypothetical protein
MKISLTIISIFLTFRNGIKFHCFSRIYTLYGFVIFILKKDGKLHANVMEQCALSHQANKKRHKNVKWRKLFSFLWCFQISLLLWTTKIIPSFLMLVSSFLLFVHHVYHVAPKMPIFFENFLICFRIHYPFLPETHGMCKYCKRIHAHTWKPLDNSNYFSFHF